MSAFNIGATDGAARTGMLRTSHGDVRTPAFMPVATLGSVKALDPEDLRTLEVGILLANAYHLYLRPGIDAIEDLGALHNFMGWDGPLLTDSGGFQGFSLEHLREITEDGIQFKSHIDGSTHWFTPEAAIEYQERLNADIIMPLDVCVAADASRVDTEVALERTNRWAERCRQAHSRPDQMLFGIVQGGAFPNLRERSVEFLTALDFPGYAIGGLSVGESKHVMYETMGLTADMLPEDAPRYLMGVGSPEDLVECVARGVDMFDCALPTRIARNGTFFVRSGRLNINNAKHRTSADPIEAGCDCYVCRTFSSAYVHHLFRSKELLAYRLATIHNLRFVLKMMEEMREAIEGGSFESYRAAFHERFTPPDEYVRREQKIKWTEAQRRRPKP